MSKRTKILKGSTILLAALATGCAGTAGPNGVQPSDLGPKAGAGLISNNAGGLISNNAGGLISNNAGGLISNNAGGLISNNAGGLISNNAGGLISNNAGGLTGTVKGPAAGLISNNAGGLISNNAGGLISNNAGGLISNNAGGLISNNAGGYNVLAAGDEKTQPIAGARVAVFNERGEQISYAWTVTDANGNYTFKRLKASGPLLFVKAVYQEGGQQVTLTSVAAAPRKPGVSEVAVSPATTFVAKKVSEMTRLRAVSAVAVKPATVAQIVAKLEPVMSDRAIVAAAIFPAERAAETFDNLMDEAPAFAADLGEDLAGGGAAATILIADTPEAPVPPTQTVVDPIETAPPAADPGTAAPEAPGSSDPGTALPGTEDPADPVGSDPGTEPAVVTNKATVGTYGSSTFGQLLVNGANLLLANGAVSTGAVGLTGSFSGDGATDVIAVAYDGATRYTLSAGKAEGGGKTVTDDALLNCVDLAILNGKGYAVDPALHAIYEIDFNAGTVSAFVGAANSPGSVDGTGTAARFKAPRGIYAHSGALYVADTENNRIRKITGAGVVTTVAGNAVGWVDGKGDQAKFDKPNDVTVLGDALYVVDSNNHVVRKVTFTGDVTTIAGGVKQLATTDGVGDKARFAFPKSIAGATVGGKATLFVTQANGTVRTLQDW